MGTLDAAESMKRILRVLCTILLVQLSGRATAADVSVKVVEKERPKQIADAIRNTLQPKAVQLLNGTTPVFEFWFCSEVPLKSKPSSPDKALDAMAETTVVGAASVAGGQRDYKDNEIPAGVYTMRFGLQPQDGDHLGTAESPYFVLLIPAAADIKPDGFASTKAMAKVSGKDTASNHPIVLNLLSVSSSGGDIPKLNQPDPEHRSVRVELPAKAGADKTSVVFELVFKGHGHIQ